MENAQELFAKACIVYEHAQELVKHVGEDIRKIQKEIDGSCHLIQGLPWRSLIRYCSLFASPISHENPGQ